MERKDKEMGGRNVKKLVGKEDKGKIKHLRDDRRDKRFQKHTCDGSFTSSLQVPEPHQLSTSFFSGGELH